MRTASILISAVALLAPAVPIAAATGGHLVSDSAVTRGRLDNGLRYAVMANADPKGGVSLLLQVRAGSLEESSSQLGAAHFIEHMAFYGTTHYAPGKLIEKLQQISPGSNVHAYVLPGLDETIYKLDLTSATPENVSAGLGILADWAGGMTLLPDQIDTQRSQLSAEIQHYNYPDQRLEASIAAAGYAGTVVGERPPVGVAASIAHLDRATLKNYYDAWYRPELMTVAVVGSINVQAVETQIRANFSPLADRASAVSRPGVNGLKLTAPGHPAFLVSDDDNSSGTHLLIERTTVEATPPDSLDRERDGLSRQIAEQVFASRIQRMVASDGNLPLANASMFSEYRLGFAVLGVRASARNKNVALRTLDLAVTEYRRMLQFGPTDAELALARTTIAADLDGAVAHATSQGDANLAEEIVFTQKSGRVFQSATQRRDLLKPILITLTPAEIVAALERFNSRPGRDLVAATGQMDKSTVSEQTVRDAYVKVMSSPAAAPAAGTANAWAYGDLADPGGTSWMTERPDEAVLGIKVLWSHPNGLRMQVRRSTVKPGQVLVSLRFDISNATVKSQRPPGVDELIERGLASGGLGKHTAAEVKALFADSSVRFTGVHVSGDAITYSATCNGKDLPRALQLLRAYYGDPGWRKEAEAPVKQAWLASVDIEKQNVTEQVDRHLQTAVAGSYAWRRPVTPDQVKALTFANARTWLNSALENDTLTVTVVGDVPANAADTMALWFGQYKVRNRFMMASNNDARATAMEPSPLKPGVEHLAVSGGRPEAVIDVVWPTDDAFDLTRTLQLDVLARCLGDRVQMALREKFGDGATVRAWSTASDSIREEGQIHLQASVAPGRADEALSFIRAQAVELANDGVTGPQLEGVKAPMLASLQREQKSNQWWFSTVLPYAGWQPFRIAWAKDTVPYVQSIGTAEVKAVAKRYLVDAHIFAVVGVDSSTGGATTAYVTKTGNQRPRPTNGASHPL